MADYTRLTTDVIKKLLDEYDLGKFESATPFDGGQANSSIKIKTRTGDYTLSVCDEKSAGEIQSLTRVLTYLETHGFPATPLVHAKNGKTFIRYEEKPVYIKRFLPGRVCPDLSPDMRFQIGQAMARLHCLAPPTGVPEQFPYGMKSFEEIFNAKISHPYVDWLKIKRDFLKKAIDPAMEKGFIHGDIFWDNLLFSNDTLVAILDFEEACTEYKLFDIGMAAVGCCAKNGLFSMDQVQQLLKGYQVIIPLTNAEKRQLKIFMEYAAVAASFWRFRQYNIKYPTAGKKDNYKELSSLADQVHTMEESLFNTL